MRLECERMLSAPAHRGGHSGSDILKGYNVRLEVDSRLFPGWRCKLFPFHLVISRVPCRYQALSYEFSGLGNIVVADLSVTDLLVTDLLDFA